MPRKDLKILQGQTIGSRTVGSYAGEKKWHTVCSCGKAFVTDGADLRRRVYRCRHDASKRFWSKVNKTDDCWLWTGAKHPDGYGQFKYKSRAERSHRWAWVEVNGPVPAGLDLDHLCRVRNCVRPSHLEPVTRRENVLRSKR